MAPTCALGLIDKALEGFSRAPVRARREREREAPGRGEILRQLQQNIQRSRDSGRGRIISQAGQLGTALSAARQG